MLSIRIEFMAEELEPASRANVIANIIQIFPSALHVPVINAQTTIALFLKIVISLVI